jgi:hypothetical protein
VVNLSLTIYAPNGTVLFNSGNLFGAPIIIPSTQQGQGNLGFGFQLDAAQAALANPFLCSSCGGNRIGIAASLSGSDGSHETFSVLDLSPEPNTLLTFVGGLIALGVLCRFKRPNRSIE